MPDASSTANHPVSSPKNDKNIYYLKKTRAAPIFYLLRNALPWLTTCSCLFPHFDIQRSSPMFHNNLFVKKSQISDTVTCTQREKIKKEKMVLLTIA